MWFCLKKIPLLRPGCSLRFRRFFLSLRKHTHCCKFEFFFCYRFIRCCAVRLGWVGTDRLVFTWQHHHTNTNDLSAIHFSTFRLYAAMSCLFQKYSIPEIDYVYMRFALCVHVQGVPITVCNFYFKQILFEAENTLKVDRSLK